MSAAGSDTVVGFDRARLERIGAFFKRYVDDERLPGWSISVARHGQLAYQASYGHRDVENGLPITDDTIYRIFSMTKPITAVAALILWEEGAFELKDPLHAYIPAFKSTPVYRSGSSQKPELEPQRNPIQLWQLFAHTAGLTYGFMYGHPVDAMYRAAGYEWGVPAGKDLATVCDDLARLPLVFQPGSEWNYSMGLDVLGRVVEIIAGQPLDEFIAERITEPLGMVDTAFFVPDDKQDRLAALYVPNPADDRRLRMDMLGRTTNTRPTFIGGGGGMAGTTSDYLRFAEMLRRGGELDGQRILGPRTVAMMASNHLPGGADLTKFGRPLFSESTFDGVGFGLGVSVTLDPTAAKVPGLPGEFGWGGAASTAFFIDPLDDLIVLFMTQLLPSSKWPIRSQLRQLVSQALID